MTIITRLLITPDCVTSGRHTTVSLHLLFDPSNPLRILLAWRLVMSDVFPLKGKIYSLGAPPSDEPAWRFANHIIWAMSRYLHEFKLKPGQDRHTSSPEYNITYSESPGSVYPSLEHAEEDCRLLNGMSVHVGHHYCEFRVQDLSDGKFAIVCESHPC